MIAGGAVPLREVRKQFTDPRAAQRYTIKLMGQAIRAGSSYPPIRNLAARVAARAAPKDYLGQVREIYNDFLGRWRYVKDPVGVEYVTASPRALWHLVLAGDGRGLGEGRGAEDCETAAAAIGAELAAIGMPVRIATVRAPDRPSGPFSHTFVQANVPGYGWISVDPVGHPAHRFGWTPPSSAMAVWDLHGQQIAGDELLGGEVVAMLGATGDHGFGAVGRERDYRWQEYDLPATTGDPLPWDVYGLAGFGGYVDSMGYIEGGRDYMVEVDEDNEIGSTGAVRTPMLELSPGPYELLNRHGIVLDGTLALGDDGAVYEYDGTLGFFKKLFKKARKLGRKVIHGAEKLIKKTKLGRKLIKLKNRMVKTALKIVKPLARIVGKWAGRLSPIAAMVPGIGTVVAGYLTAAGVAAKLMDKYGVKLMQDTITTKSGKKKKVRKLMGKPSNIKKFQHAMKRASRKAKRLPKSELKRQAAKLKGYRGKRLPRQPLSGIDARERILKKGSPQWFAAMRAIGLRRGPFAIAPGQPLGRRRPRRQRPLRRRAPLKVAGRHQVIARGGPAAKRALALRRAR